MPHTKQVFMVNWDEKKIWCNTCEEWVKHDKIWIDGTHDFLNTSKRSTHTLWEDK